MDEQLTNTARDFYTVKIINGAIPEQFVGGALDGLSYFTLTLARERARDCFFISGHFNPVPGVEHSQNHRHNGGVELNA